MNNKNRITITSVSLSVLLAIRGLPAFATAICLASLFGAAAVTKDDAVAGEIDWPAFSRQHDMTFDKPVAPDDNGPIEGFAIAGEDGKYYKAYAESLVTKDQGIWGNKYDRTKLFVWSPLVKKPVAVRYAWATSPMGNLKVNGKPWQPLHSFRTDKWDWPENEDPAEEAVTRAKAKEIADEAAQRCEFRRVEEAKRAVEILERLKTLGKVAPKVN